MNIAEIVTPTNNTDRVLGMLHSLWRITPHDTNPHIDATDLTFLGVDTRGRGVFAVAHQTGDTIVFGDATEEHYETIAEVADTLGLPDRYVVACRLCLFATDDLDVILVQGAAAAH